MFAKNLKYLREKKNMDQQELAERLGKKSSSSISEWEKGKYTPRIGVLNDISEIFNVSISDLMNTDLSQNNLTIDDQINSVVSQLKEDNKIKVLSYAQKKLTEQNNSITGYSKTKNIKEFPSTNKNDIDEDYFKVKAAHIDDDATEEDFEEIRAYKERRIQMKKDERK